MGKLITGRVVTVEQERPRGRGRPARRKTCPCGKQYWPSSGSQKSCSEACALAAGKRRAQEYRLGRLPELPREGSWREYAPRGCASCGSEFRPRSGNHRVCRGPGCK